VEIYDLVEKGEVDLKKLNELILENKKLKETFAYTIRIQNGFSIREYFYKENIKNEINRYEEVFKEYKDLENQLHEKFGQNIFHFVLEKLETSFFSFFFRKLIKEIRDKWVKIENNHKKFT
jgi:hypothetical protein